MKTNEEFDNGRMSAERWKEAVKAASNDANYRRERGFTETRDDFFVDGVQWADEHPKTGMVDLNMVWHDASEEPEDNKFIFVTTEYNEFFMSPNKPDSQGRGFSHYKKIMNYKQWAYVDDFLPLGWQTKKEEE